MPESDTGTHVDPVTAAADTPNHGRFRYVLASTAFTRVGDAAVTAVDARLTAVEAPLRFFRSTVTDPLLLAAVTDVRVWGAFDFENFYFNREAYDYGDPFYKWFKVDVHGPSGAVVAFWTRNNINTATQKPWVFLTNIVNGAVQPGHEGFVLGLEIDWLALDALGWTHLKAGFAGSLAASGLERSLNHPPQDLERFLTDFAPYATTTVGVGGTEATVASAFAALLLDDGTVLSRSTIPNSDLCTPATPRETLIVDPAHDEAVVPQTILGIQNGLIMPHWVSLTGPKGARLYMPAGGDAPVLEANQPCRVKGIKLENFGDGYGAHMDPGDIVRRAVTAPMVLRYRYFFLFEDVEIVVHGLDDQAIGLGGAVGNGMKALFRRVRFKRGAGTAPLVAFHTTENMTDPAELGFDTCLFDPAFTAVELIKLHETDVVSTVWFKDCEGGAINCNIGEGIGGGQAFARAGAITGFTSVSANLDPA